MNTTVSIALAGNREPDIIVDLDYEHASILLNCTSQVEFEKRANACAKEPETVEFCESMRPGDVLFDVGANCGAYSLIAASRGVTVHAFEPHRPTFDRLKENVTLNNADVTCHPFVLTDHDGQVGMNYSSSDPGAALHRVTVGEDHACYQIDTLIAMQMVPRPTHIKVDTDGHELAVIEGARLVLGTVESIQVELDDADLNYDWTSILTILRSCGLRVYKWTRHGDTSVSNVLLRR